MGRTEFAAASMFSASFRRFSSTAATINTRWKIKLPKRFQGGFIEKWGNYWAGIAQDYKEVCVDIVKDSYKYPTKAAFYYSLIAGGTYAFIQNPDEREFRNQLVLHMHQNAMIGSKIRNEAVDQHLRYIADCLNHDLIRRWSFGLFSIIWVDNYGKECANFKTQCDWLKPRYLTFHERIMDVGFV